MTWDAVGHTYHQFNHWPDPFRNAPKSIKKLACENTFQAEVEMIGLAIGAWAWSAFIPQPTEIVRKTLTGSYKCGFYLGLKVKSPLDIVWQDESASRALMEILHPVATGIFYMWAAEAAWEALSTWQSIVYAQEMCNLDRNECLLANGNGSFFNTGGLGDPDFYVVLWDPNGWHPSFSGFISIPTFAHVTCSIYGYLVSTINNVTACRIWIESPGHGESNPLAEVDFGAFPNNTTRAWSLTCDADMSPGNINVRMRVTMNAPPLSHLDIFVTRFTVHESPERQERKCTAYTF